MGTVPVCSSLTLFAFVFIRSPNDHTCIVQSAMCVSKIETEAASLEITTGRTIPLFGNTISISNKTSETDAKITHSLLEKSVNFVISRSQAVACICRMDQSVHLCHIEVIP